MYDLDNKIREKQKSIQYDLRNYPIHSIIEFFRLGEYYIPSYQRNFVWKKDIQSKFIESVLLKVPLTPFLASIDENGRLEIIDGSQRIRTLIAFYENKLGLRNLEKLDKINILNGK